MASENKQKKEFYETGSDEWKTYIEDTVRLGLVEFLVLRLLCQRDMYGYEIKNMLSKQTNKAFVMREASLYGALYRMMARGMISSTKRMAGEKRFRMYYHIEEPGRQYLEYGEQQIRIIIDGMLMLFNSDKGEA